MNEVQKEINNAYKMISTIAVSGDAVDTIAACKMSLRCAFKLAEDKPEEDKPEEDKEG